MDSGIKVINEQVKEKSAIVDALLSEVSKAIVGQRYMVERLLLGILTGGHILVEGVPGLAKTLAIKSIADAVDCSFKRIQFTPDLLPADLTGTQIYNPKDGTFTSKKGPIFANLILADEINRAPAKVQSALLEAMQEKQVTVGDNTYKLPDIFLVMATQNPIEQEGTYPLPEAQVDRFMLKLKITYPSKEEELEILERYTTGKEIKVSKVCTLKEIEELKAIIPEIYVDDRLKKYVVNIVDCTRNPENYGLEDLKVLIDYGASPRATLSLITAAKGLAAIRRRGYITPEDIKAVAPDVLRHRIIVSYEAEAEQIDSDAIIRKIFDEIEVP